MRAHATRGELDRQRYAVELSADLCHDRRIAVRKLESIAAGRRTSDEQLRRREGDNPLCGRWRIIRRAFESREPIDMLAFHPQRLSAGRQDMNLRRFRENLLGHRRGRIDDVLATVE